MKNSVIPGSLQDKFTALQERFLRLSRAKQIAAILALILLATAILRSGTEKKEEPIADTVRTVAVTRVADLSNNTAPIPLLGTVTSRSEATIRAEGSGKLNIVYKRLGDRVAAGDVIAEFENSAERAQVLQAEGAYEAAKAGRDIAGISSGSAGNSLSETKTQAQNTITSAYTGLDDAIRTKTDAAWRNPQTRDAKLAVNISDAKLVIELEAKRTNIEDMLRKREARNKTLTGESDLIAELDTVEGEVNMVKDYLDDLSLAFNRALPDANASPATIEGYKTSTGIARASVGGLLSSVAGTRNALKGAAAAAAIAEKSGAGSGSSSADAQLKSALGNLRAAQSRLEKTIIRSPISGTINSLSVDTGDYVAPFSEVAVVSNNVALEIVGYATEDEQREISVGATASIEGGISGVVTRVAPALDPRTKKAELRIGITGKASTLINGQSVSVLIARGRSGRAVPGVPTIPLSAMKLTPDGALVFTVEEGGVLVAHPVKEGTLQGDRISVPEGLTPDMEIVVDARGLKEGVRVNVK